MAKPSKKQEKWLTADAKRLLEAVAAIRNKKEAGMFLRDLLTENELMEFANRWKVARMLARKVPYLEIAEQTGMSSTTIARIKKWVAVGRGGYRLMIKRLGTK